METTEIEPQTPQDAKPKRSYAEMTLIILKDLLKHSKPKDRNTRQIIAGSVAAIAVAGIFAFGGAAAQDPVLGFAVGAFFFACPMLGAYVWFLYYTWEPETWAGKLIADSLAASLSDLAENLAFLSVGVGFFALAWHAGVPLSLSASCLLILISIYVTTFVLLIRRARAWKSQEPDSAETPR